MLDVAVVGGGPVGIFLACLLATNGLDVRVFEQRTEPSMRSRAIGIHPPSLAALEQIGVAEELLEQAVRIRDGEVWCGGHRMGRLSFEKAAASYPFVVALPQYVTEALLVTRFEELAPGGLHRGVSVIDVREAVDRVSLSTTDGTTIDARFVVAADGARSAVRGAVGIGWRKLGRRETYLMADFPELARLAAVPDPAPAVAAPAVAAPGATRETAAAQTTAARASTAEARAAARARADRATTAVLYFERGGVVESFPLPSGRRRWVAMTDELRTEASPADLADIIRARTGIDLPGSADVPSPFVVQQRLADRMVAGRVVLIGDAAHEISPIGGQGMNLGWLDAVALAPALGAALRDPSAAPSALGEFERRRRRAAWMASRQAAFNMTMGRPYGGGRLRARNALVRTLALPPARAVLARAFTMRWL
jgi:2-polyprenyl-6-methoxyphenol hydroxylase-like FAD-dependent oxidoreductase